MRRKIKYHRALHPQVRILNVLLMGVIVVLGILALWKGPLEPFKSAEVAFSDVLKGGMLVVPASCASAPPLAPGNDNGLQVPSGTYNGEINRLDINFCITNTGGPTYFIPLYTKAELQAFYNAAVVTGLPGVTTGAN
jgi:hypothetical protein